MSARLKPLAGVSAIALMFAAVSAMAQDVPPPAAVDQADESTAESDGREIVVTGSSIRGVAPVGSSLVSIGREQIDQSTAVTTAQLLLESPQVLNSGISESSRNGPGGSSNTTSATAISLRGLGPYATLTLFNGHRPVPNGTTAGFVDPSAIPTIALQRVEIVPDGASAIYGSDAVAGVVNLILRRRYEGIGMDAQIGIGKDGFTQNTFGVIAGHDWDSGRAVIAYQHGYRTAIGGRDRDYYTGDLRSRGGADYRLTQCSPGNLVVGGVSYAIPQGGATPTNLLAGTANRCDVQTQQDILPRQEYNSVSLTAEQELAPGFRMSLDGYWTRRDVFRRLAPLYQNLTVPRTNAFYVAPQGLNPASVQVQYNFGHDFGATAPSTGYSRAYQVDGAFEADIVGDIVLTVGGGYGWNRDQSDSADRLNTAALTAALASNDPATAFNPFGTSTNNSAVLAGIADSLGVNFGTAKQYTANAKIDGSLFHIGGGDVRFAVGTEYLDLSLVTGTLRGVSAAPTYFARDLGRNVKSAYAEVFVPLVGSENAMPGIQRLELNVAGRFEDYSDVGKTSNPKFGVNWSPVAGLTLRGSYGTSFRAPSLTQVYTPAGGGLYIRSYPDPKANGGAGGIVQGVALYGDNLKLKPETAKTWSLGAEYELPIARNARISVNYFNLRYDGQIVNFLQNLSVLQREDAYASIIVRGPSQALLQGLLNQGLTVSGGTAASVLAAPVLVYASHANLGVTKASGLDFQMSATIPAGSAGDFRVGAQGTRYFNFDVALTPLDTAKDRKNEIDYPLTFRTRAWVGWNKGGLDVVAYVNYANAYLNNYVTPVEPIKSYTTVDLSVSYMVAENLRIGIEGNNIFDRDPPYVNAAPVPNGAAGYDPQVGNPIGGIVSLTAQIKF